MCCIKLDAKVILNNFFGSPDFGKKIKGGRVKKETINQCSIFISNNLPGYVICDLSENAIEEAVEDGNFEYDVRGEDFIFKHKIDRRAYNQFYPQVVAEQLEHIVDYFLRNDLYEEHVEPVKTLIG